MSIRIFCCTIVVMALVPRRQRQTVPMATISEVANIVQELAPALKQAVTAGLRAGQVAGGARKSSKKGRKARAGGKKGDPSVAASNPEQNQAYIAGSLNLAGNDKLRMVQKEIVTVNNQGTAGVHGSGIVLGLGTTLAGIATLTSTLPRFAGLNAMYRQFTINSLVFSWVPNQGYTAGGTVCMGIDPLPFAGAATSISSVLHHSASKMFDVKSGATLVWKPQMANKGSAPRYTQQLSTVGEDELTFGVFQIYSSNSLPAGANIGNLVITADITFMGAT